MSSFQPTPPRLLNRPPLRSSTDPVYHSFHFDPNPHPPYTHSPAAFHTKSLQARNYLSPPSIQAASPGIPAIVIDVAALQAEAELAAPSKGEPVAGIEESEVASIIPSPIAERLESYQNGRKGSFQPLWEDSETMSGEEVERFRERGRRVSELAGKLVRFWGREDMVQLDDSRETESTTDGIIKNWKAPVRDETLSLDVNGRVADGGGGNGRSFRVSALHLLLVFITRSV